MIRNKTVFALSSLAMAASAVIYVAPAMAQTSVTVSGLIDVEVNSQTNSTTGQRVSSINGADGGPNGGMQTSYFQFAGDEDLGGGLKASFALGTFVQPGNGSSGRFNGDVLFSRDANVSLKGGFGGVTLGRQINPVFLSTLIFNPFADSFSYSPIIQQTYATTGGQPQFGAGSGFAVNSADTGYSNAVSYSTPNFEGLSAELLYSLSGANGQSSSFSANALYFHGPFAATVAYEDTTVTGPSNNTFTLGGAYPVGTKQKVSQLGASYDFAPVKLFLQYQHTETTLTAVAETKLNTLQAGATVAAGQGNFMLSYAKTGGVLDHKTYALGYDYNLSKSTDIYTAYMNDKELLYAYAISSFGVGVRHRF